MYDTCETLARVGMRHILIRMNEPYDFVAIGDITTDAFITLKDAAVHCNIDHENCELCVRFGDKIPFEKVDVVVAVGNSPNASVSAARLGLKSALITNMGDDQNGKDCLATLQKNGVATDYVIVEAGKPTNYHYVLRYGAERTILVKHHEYAYRLPEFKAPPKWIYLSSLGENSIPFQKEIAAYVQAHPETKLAFQPGTFQIKKSEELADVYQASELFFCNKEEARRILNLPNADFKELLDGMRGKGPKTVVITDGPNGAYASDGTGYWRMPMYPDPAPPVSRTGAGDAFSSTFTAALALGKSIPEALAWGPINSMNVVQHIGAQTGLLPRAELEGLLAKAPGDYVASSF